MLLIFQMWKLPVSSEITHFVKDKKQMSEGHLQWQIWRRSSGWMHFAFKALARVKVDYWSCNLALTRWSTNIIRDANVDCWIWFWFLSYLYVENHFLAKKGTSKCNLFTPQIRCKKFHFMKIDKKLWPIIHIHFNSVNINRILPHSIGPLSVFSKSLPIYALPLITDPLHLFMRTKSEQCVVWLSTFTFNNYAWALQLKIFSKGGLSNRHTSDAVQGTSLQIRMLWRTLLF